MLRRTLRLIRKHVRLLALHAWSPPPGVTSQIGLLDDCTTFVALIFHRHRTIVVIHPDTPIVEIPRLLRHLTVSAFSLIVQTLREEGGVFGVPSDLAATLRRANTEFMQGVAKVADGGGNGERKPT